MDEDTIAGTSKTKRNTHNCCVPQCAEYSQKGTSMHLFPKNVEYRKKWECVLKLGKPSSDYMKVCSKHFLPTDYFSNRKYYK